MQISTEEHIHRLQTLLSRVVERRGGARENVTFFSHPEVAKPKSLTATEEGLGDASVAQQVASQRQPISYRQRIAETLSLRFGARTTVRP